jgi:mRNA-degrading endonuclease toxin of MazEF toxin-antitoxin module
MRRGEVRLIDLEPVLGRVPPDLMLDLDESLRTHLQL